MKDEEFFKLKNALKREHDLKLKDLYKNYAEQNSEYKVGDIISDHWHTLKIDKIGVTLNFSHLPQCVYFGRRYTKKGVPTKREERATIYQSNIVK